MPNKRANVKNEKQYEKLKEKGMSKERAAKIANPPGARAVVRRPARANHYMRRTLRPMRPETLTCRVGAGLSRAAATAEAAGEAAREAREALAGADVDLAFLFLTADHIDGAEEALEAASEELDAAHLLGCVAEGIVGHDQELEQGPGASVWA